MLDISLSRPLTYRYKEEDTMADERLLSEEVPVILTARDYVINCLIGCLMFLDSIFFMYSGIQNTNIIFICIGILLSVVAVGILTMLILAHVKKEASDVPKRS